MNSEQVGCPQVNKFEQVFSDYHQLSVAEVGIPGPIGRGRGGIAVLQIPCRGVWESQVPFPGGGIPGPMSGGGSTLPCDLSHDACDVPTPSPVKTLPSPNFDCRQ